MLIRLSIFIAILCLVDFYAFQGIKNLVRNSTPLTSRIVFYSYWGFFALIVTSTFLGLLIPFQTWDKHFITIYTTVFVIIFFSKIIVVLFLLIDDLFRLIRFLVSLLPVSSVSDLSTGRSDFIIKLGLVVAAIPFGALIYGMLGSAYNYQIRKVALRFPNLPKSFHGLRIVQISDFHVGSFFDKERVKVAVNKILEQKADLIFFTGDLVNDVSTEVDMFVDELNRISAPMGVFSILGNHDYGDYVAWESKAAKAANLERLASLQKSFGWDLIRNGHRIIERNGEKISLIGVENWSNFGRFTQYGDMSKATAGMERTPFTMLLSHDPSHWQGEVKSKYSFIDLTLSGHTHGMQFGIEIPGFRWSPVKYFYKNWADLYKEGNQYIYVNRGIGYIGYPGRVGILPEITVFELSA